MSDRTPQEHREQIVALAKGDKGEQGERGQPGEQGRRGEPLTRASRRALIYLFGVSLAIGAANLYWTAREVGQLRSAVVASCGFAADLASAPITVSPATGKPSELGVKIVSDSRVQWHGLGCPGVLPPPAPSFVKWARYYQLPSN